MQILSKSQLRYSLNIFYRVPQTTQVKNRNSDKLKRGKSVDTRRGRQSRNIERNLRQKSKMDENEENTAPTVNNRLTKTSLNSPVKANGEKAQESSGSNENNTKLEEHTISKRIFEKTKVAECYLYRCGEQRTQDSRTDFSALDGECSKTFIKSSYKVSGLLVTNAKHNKSLKKRPSLNSLCALSNQTNFDKGRKSYQKASPTETSAEKAKKRYMDRKKQFEGKKHRKHGTLKQGVSCQNIKMTHKKTLSNINNYQY